MNEDEATIEIDRLDGACPVQAMGNINDHSSFYFRGRHEAWQFAAGPQELGTDGLVEVLIGIAEDPRVFVLRGDDDERLYLDYDHVRDALQGYAEQYIAWKAKQSVVWVKEKQK